MSLVADYESSPESDNRWNKEPGSPASSGEDDAETAAVYAHECKGLNTGDAENTAKTNNVTKLPSATSVIDSSPAVSSVWGNKYQKEDEDKTKALERHVKMVNNSKSTPLNGRVNGKKVCWMYRRGRCRLGKKCQMYHDSELQTTDGDLKQNNAKDSNVQEILSENTLRKRSQCDNLIEEDEDKGVPKPKKRFGLSDGIIPSKKVIKHFERVTGSKTGPRH